jgi:hypothetical protein
VTITKFQHEIDTVPFRGVGLIALMACVSLLDVAAAIGWLLRLLEIQSVYDRVLPDWSTMDFFIASVAATIAVKLLAKGLPG